MTQVWNTPPGWPEPPAGWTPEPRYSGARAQAIHDELGLSVTRYEQKLNALLDRPDAYEHDPMLVKRLRRLRDTRRQARAG